ncbi:MAG: sigma-70 family RNA polymerase sigma factor [Blastocatellia bacterium]
MTVDRFLKAFSKDIADALARVSRRYNVTDDELTSALYSSARKYFPELATDESEARLDGLSGPIIELLGSINSEDLCLAVACAKGDDGAWGDFMREYRGYLVSIARSVTQELGAAEQLADSAFAELYGLRESAGARVSKFSFYSGRGSLRGWLRAVVYQLSADSYRKTGRFVQTEEESDMERLSAASPMSQKTEVEVSDSRYQPAVAEALHKAINDLDPKERLLLAHYYYDELTLKEIGKLFGVHEATVCRWLAKVQKRIRKLVEKSLARDHHFNRRQVAEAVELAAEAGEISIGDYLLESTGRNLEPAETPEPQKEAFSRSG